MKEDTIGMMLKLWATRKVQVITKLSSNQGKALSRFSFLRRKHEHLEHRVFGRSHHVPASQIRSKRKDFITKKFTMSHFAVEDPELAASHKEGFLSKRSKNARFYSQWNRHWFKMSNHWLHYYLDQWERPPPLCAYDLRAMSDVLLNSDPKSKEFKMVSAGSKAREYHFRAETREDAKEWVKKLDMRLSELRSSKNHSIKSPGRYRGFLNLRRAADKGLLSANLLQVIHMPSKRRWCQIEYDSKLRCRTFCVYENRQHEKVGSREGIAAGNTMAMIPLGLKKIRTRSNSPIESRKPIMKLVLRTVTFEYPHDPQSLEFLIRTSRDSKHVLVVDTDSRVHLEDWITSLRAYVDV